MAARYDLLTARPGKDGKTYWTKLGSMWPLENGGFSLNFDALPIAQTQKDGTVATRVFAFEPRERDGRRGGGRGGESAPTSRTQADLDDEIPF